VQVVDHVTSACQQICVHLSEPLYDLVLNMVYEYASTNVRANAVRAIHQLVECVANADPAKTLAKFFHFCFKNIQIELENGACSVRSTSSSTLLPSDATLHWSEYFFYVVYLKLSLVRHVQETDPTFQILLFCVEPSLSA
jgi:proteasome activator subunit 4